MAVCDNFVSLPLQQAHLQRLTELYDQRVREIKGADDLEQYCPHLSRQQVEGLVDQSKRASVVFATPAVLIKGATNDLQLRVDDSKKLVLTFIRTMRTRESYKDTPSHQTTFEERSYSREAMQYANTHWGDQLFVDDWNDVQKVRLIDPSSINENGVPTRGGIIWSAINVEWRFLHSRLKETTLENAWGQHMRFMTMNPILGSELFGGRSFNVGDYCSLCSYGFENISSPVDRQAHCIECKLIIRSDLDGANHLTNKLPFCIPLHFSNDELFPNWNLFEEAAK